MGIYVYKTTPKATKQVTMLTTEGVVKVVRVQMYSFAFKPYGGMDSTEMNEKARARHVVPAYRAFEKTGTTPLELGVFENINVGDQIYASKGVISCYEFADGMAVVGTVLALSKLAKVPSDGLQVSIDADEISRRYHGQPLDFFVNAHSSYRPTVMCIPSAHIKTSVCELAEKTIFADAYDAAQKTKGDSRRAYRA